MHDTKVAKRYARALYAEAKANDTIGSVETDLQSILNLLHNGAEFKDFLFSPHVAREEKIRIADRLFSDRVTALTMQFLRLVLEKRRESVFDTIVDEFVNLRREYSNVIFATVISARPLEDAYRSQLEKTLSEKTGKKVETAYDVDPGLIGGLKVAYGNYVLDGTVKGSLRRLSDSWRHDVLKQAEEI